MTYIFDGEVAKMVGVNGAVLFQNIAFWVAKNQANNQNCVDGEYWTYNSNQAFVTLFPFMSADQIRTALKKLEEKDLIKSGTFNDKAFDRTKWYTFGNLGKSIWENYYVPFGKNPKPIPYVNTDINADISNSNYLYKEKENYEKKEKGFNPPSLDEVKAYIKEKGYRFNPNDFYDYYASANWHKGDGKPVRNWRQCCATWESHAHGNAASVTRRPIIDISDPNTYANGRDEKERLTNWD